MTGDTGSILAIIGVVGGFLGSAGAFAAFLRVKSQNRVDNTSSSEAERDGTYKRLSGYVDQVEADNKRLRSENIKLQKDNDELRERTSELTAQLDECISSHVPRRRSTKRTEVVSDE